MLATQMSNPNSTPVPDNRQTLDRFIQQVWNEGDASAADAFLADEYVIHSDPGDPWDGQTLSREAFKQRLAVSRSPFPDLRFDIVETIADGDRVAIAWMMRGTQTGALGDRPASGRAIDVHGMTMYYFRGGRITGHRQILDRIAVARQLGLMG
jgi:steroid delta-isomerase-like uncharacterized protein